MAVGVATALHVETFEGESYYFCCDGCLASFRSEPAKYAAIHHAARAGAGAIASGVRG